MKSFVLLTLVSAAAFGNVGQTANYNLDFNGTKGTLSYKVESEDQVEYTVSQNITLGDQNENGSSVLKKENIMTKERAQMILTYCKQMGGKLDKVGKYNACKAKANNVYLKDFVAYIQSEFNVTPEYVWIGSIPIYGIVKFTSDNGLTALVNTYSW